MASSDNSGRANPVAAVRHAHVIGWGMAVPETAMTNAELSAFVETNDEWIYARTGIRQRFIANEGESTATLAYRAAQQALEVADILPTDLDLIVVATSTAENIFPSTASLVQDWLNAHDAGAFDLSAACSGFVYALNMASDSIRVGSIDAALVIGAETMSRILDWQDRSTCILFGDGAGAVVLKASESPGGVLASVLRSDGSGGDLLAIPSVGSIDASESRAGANGSKLYKMSMAGGEVFKFATRVVSESVEQACRLAEISVSDIDLVIPHQANLRILQAAARKLGIDVDRFMSNVERYGNTSAASIPIALCEAIEQKRVQDKDHIALVGFGGGLTWASMIIRWGISKPSEQHGSLLNRQRRHVQYRIARWRSRSRRWRRRVNSRVRDLQS
ncbi:MAG: ketoacyl-ACP synthase III [Chloroflexota bacterium]|nr:ketoacyl-ACP synthase III [Chloroflexota bacterium]MDE2908066.1 ketoacyl-ACP synthase III [Chloroflexota bacterium]